MKNSEEKSNEKKLDAGLVFVLFQLLSVAALIVFAICARFIGGDFYSAVKGWYDDNINEKTSVEQVLGAELLNIKSSNLNSFCLPARGQVTSKYGYRTHPLNGDYSLHRGIDIGGEMGEKVLCAFNGVVSEVGYGKSYGNYIIVMHGEQLSTVYAHCSKILAYSGQEINRGDIIALMGDSGNTTGPHLHFEICLGGEPIDPQWIVGTYEI